MTMRTNRPHGGSRPNSGQAIPYTRFRMVVQLLSSGASRRTIMRQAGVYRLTVDSIAKGQHARQVNADKYKARDENTRIFCPHCHVELVKLPCVACRAIRFKGI